MGTKAQEIELANKGEGCLGKAAVDEPLFILRAQDCFAPELVEAWAHKVMAARGATTQKAREAMAVAHEMRAWAARYARSKVPD